MDSRIAYLPATGDRPAEPAPYVMTEDDVARFIRSDSGNVYHQLKRYRERGWLKATQVGNHVRYLLPDVLKFLETAKAENPR